MKCVVPILCLFLVTGTTAQGAPVRIMPLGDSITVGYYTGAPVYNGYRKELKNLLDAGGYNTDFVGSEADGNFGDIQHEGHNGWHADTTGTNDILGQVAGWMASTPTDIVLLHVGTNDILDNSNDTDAAEVSAILDAIFSANSNATVVLALIINADATWSNAVSAFNGNVNAMAQARILAGDDLIVVDMEHGAGLDYASEDMVGIHPSPTGYDKMATNWYPVVCDAIAHQLTASAPHIDSISVDSMSVVLDIGHVAAGTTVNIEQTASLTHTNWTLAGSLTTTNTTATWTAPSGQTNLSRFYRVFIP